MDMDIFQLDWNIEEPSVGSLLLASPFLADIHFARAVILMVEETEEGAMGIVMNKRNDYDLMLHELVSDLDDVQPIPVYKGGPVGTDILFYLHKLKNLEGATPLGHGLYLNGNFDHLKQYIKEGNPVDGVIRFFTGYAGWSAGQLNGELQEKSWTVVSGASKKLIKATQGDLWKGILQAMGGKYELWSHYPIFPMLN